ncbi:MAG: GreA/GreB family elongation factor, partial [Cryomorphaceae bacterium]
MKKSIIISQKDYKILIKILDRASFVDPVQKACLNRLLLELERATIVADDQLPDNVVRFGSTIDIEIPMGVKDGLTIVLPEEADFNRKKISVISPLGSAILGYQEGDVIHWPLRNGTQSIIICKVDNSGLKKVKGPIRV